MPVPTETPTPTRQPGSSIPDWLRSLYGTEQNMVQRAYNQATGAKTAVNPSGTYGSTGGAQVGGFAQRVQDLMNAGYDYDQAIEMASAEMEAETFYAELNQGGSGSGTAAAQISADAQRDVARMEVDARRYEADVSYRAAIDVVTQQVDADRYAADREYQAAVDVAQINGDAARDVQRMDVDARRYEADSSYRQAVDVAQITAYTDRMLGLGEIGLGYYQTLAEMQKNPADWVSYWYATQGKELPEGYAGAGIPEGLQLPSWLQGLYEDAGYSPTTWEAPVPELGAQPELLGPPQWQPSADPVRQRALDRYARSTQGEKDALARATPEQVAALWQGGQAPSMSGGGRMTIREPASIVGLHSGSVYATLAEEAPEEVNIKSQKKTAQEQGTQSYGGTRGTPRSFTSGGEVDVEDEGEGPTMPPWLKTLSEGGRQQYPAANLAGLPPAPSAQYMRGMSDSAFEGLQGVVEKGGGPSSMPVKY